MNHQINIDEAIAIEIQHTVENDPITGDLYDDMTTVVFLRKL